MSTTSTEMPTSPSDDLSLFEDQPYRYPAIHGALLLVEHQQKLCLDDLVAILIHKNIVDIRHWAHQCGPSSIEGKLCLTAFIAVDHSPSGPGAPNKSLLKQTLCLLGYAERLCLESDTKTQLGCEISAWLKCLWNIQKPDALHVVPATNRTDALTSLKQAVLDIDPKSIKRPKPSPSYLESQVEIDANGRRIFRPALGDWKTSKKIRTCVVFNPTDETRKAFVTKANRSDRPQRQEVWDGIRALILGKAKPEKHPGGRPKKPLLPWQQDVCREIQKYQGNRLDHKAIANALKPMYPSITSRKVSALIGRIRKQDPDFFLAQKHSSN